MEYMILWAFVAFFNGQPNGAAYSNLAACDRARTYLEHKMVEDGDDDGDWIAGECKPFTLVEPKARLQ